MACPPALSITQDRKAIKRADLQLVLMSSPKAYWGGAVYEAVFLALLNPSALAMLYCTVISWPGVKADIFVLTGTPTAAERSPHTSPDRFHQSRARNESSCPRW